MTGSPAASLRRHRHGGRPLDRHQESLKGEAALLVRLQLVAVRGELRIDERHRLAVLARAYDEDAAEHADLRRREARPVGALHDRLQSPNELVELVVERFDLPCPHAQDRVRVLADLRERDELPGFSLGIRPLFLSLVDLFGLVDRLRVGLARHGGSVLRTWGHPMPPPGFQRTEESRTGVCQERDNFVTRETPLEALRIDVDRRREARLAH